MRPFRFLGNAGFGVVSASELADTARRAEASGYSCLVIPDHLIEQHAPIPVLATVAAVTERLRIGTFVFNSGLRHPAVLAQDLASLDVLSGGRLEIGIGAGWNRPEHDAIGIPFPPVGARVERLGEAITVLKGCFGDGPFSFTGTHYTITDHDSHPKPVQRPYPPFFVGGGGKRVLSLAAREAQIVGVAPRLLPGDQTDPRSDPRSITLAALEEKVGWIREAAGERFDQIELNTYPSGGPIVVTDNVRAEVARRADDLRERSGMDVTDEDVLNSPHVFIGSVASLTEKFHMLRERFGISSFMLDDIEAMAPVVAELAGK